jgi:type IV secretory pathway VirB4 component
MKNENVRNSESNSTQKYLEIDTIQDNVVVLKDGGLRAVLMASSVNFDLKATDEQESIIHSYQNFLNSLDFPIQIQISTRPLNIAGYLDYLRTLQKTQRNELLRIQAAEYIQFLEELIDNANIVSKTFYIVVPYDPVAGGEDGVVEKLTSALNPRSKVRYSKEDFEQHKTQLWQRVNNTMYGLKRARVDMVPLETQELIELFYAYMNPDSKPTESLDSIEKLDIT